MFDHNLPHKLRTILGSLYAHEIVTASFMKWGHLKNGELLRAAEVAGVDVFVTGDQSLVHEQNLTGRRLAIIALWFGCPLSQQKPLSSGLQLFVPKLSYAGSSGSLLLI